MEETTYRISQRSRNIYTYIWDKTIYIYKKDSKCEVELSYLDMQYIQMLGCSSDKTHTAALFSWLIRSHVYKKKQYNYVHREPMFFRV